MRILKKAITDTPHISIDMEQTQHSKTFNKIPATDIVISIGCDVGCLYSGISFDNNRKLQDPTGQSDAVLIEVIKQMHGSVRERISQVRKIPPTRLGSMQNLKSL